MTEYYPAVCRPDAYPTPSFKLVIFPPCKAEAFLDVPVKLGVFTYAPSGTAIYTWTMGAAGTCLYKVELNPVRVTPVTCPPSFGAVFSVAISAKEDRFLISGATDGESGSRCGVFEIRLADGTIKRYPSHWELWIKPRLHGFVEKPERLAKHGSGSCHST